MLRDGHPAIWGWLREQALRAHEVKIKKLAIKSEGGTTGVKEKVSHGCSLYQSLYLNK